MVGRLQNGRVTHPLFVYGTLAPGMPNEHVLADVPGHWESAIATGTLLEHGWAASLGFPALRLDAGGTEVEGFLFTSGALDELWERLDEFEGEEYERVVTEVRLADGRTVPAFTYVHREAADPAV
jgi:gamma-glutamylcyclotransferase (GGCT)/AIG2-like uncharacterized protein YtfP